MKQYDKIYVHIDINEEPAYDFLSNGTGAESALGVRENCIVITLEELREVFEAGYKKGCHSAWAVYNDQPETEASPDLKTYLTSKGVKLD